MKVKPKLQWRSHSIKNDRTTECPLRKAASRVELAHNSCVYCRQQNWTGGTIHSIWSSEESATGSRFQIGTCRIRCFPSSGFQSCFGLIFSRYVSIPPFGNRTIYPIILHILFILYIGSMQPFSFHRGSQLRDFVESLKRRESWALLELLKAIGMSREELNTFCIMKLYELTWVKA